MRLMEYLYCTLLRDLHHALFKLLALHRVDTLDRGKMLRREGRDTLEHDILTLLAYCIADREDAGVKNADNISGIGLVDNGALLRHQLLRLSKPQRLSALHVVIFSVALKPARTYAHESDPVAVRLVHICLYLEYKCGKMIVKRVNDSISGHSGQRRHSHAQKALKKRFYAEIIERRAKEHGAEFSATHFFYIKIVACAVKKLNIVRQGRGSCSGRGGTR